jgi:flavin-binding protein dodecin
MVVKLIEIIGVSSKSFDDAIAQGLERSTKTVKNITGIDIKGQTAAVKDGNIMEYRVHMNLAFVVED